MVDRRQPLRELVSALAHAAEVWTHTRTNLDRSYEAAAKPVLAVLDKATAGLPPSSSSLRGRVDVTLGQTLSTVNGSLDQVGIGLARVTNESRAALGAASQPDPSWRAMSTSIHMHAGALARGLPPADATVEDIHQWWTSLSDDARAEAVEHYGDQLGRIDGIPIPERSTCNERRLLVERGRLVAQHDEFLGRRLSLREEGRLQRLKETIGGLDAVKDMLANERARGREAFLIDFDTAGNGTLRFAVGNPATARYVATYVAGGGTSLADAGSTLDKVAHLREMTERLHSGPDSDPHTAVIANIYQIKKPVAVGIMGTAMAKAAAPSLARFQHGLRVIRPERAAGEPPVRWVGIHHSYGNIVAAEAARTHGYAVDAFVINGVGGTGSNRASEFGVPEVYATLMPNDPLRVIDRLRVPHGPQPVTPAFGAIVFASGPGPAGSLPGRTSMDSHFGYFSDTLTVINNAEIILGNQPHHTRL